MSTTSMMSSAWLPNGIAAPMCGRICFSQ